MKRLLTVKEMAERYRCSEKTARRYMRSMEHMEKPLRVTETAVESWEYSRTHEAQTAEPVRRRQKRRPVHDGVIYISRVRGKLNAV